MGVDRDRSRQRESGQEPAASTPLGGVRWWPKLTRRKDLERLACDIAIREAQFERVLAATDPEVGGARSGKQEGLRSHPLTGLSDPARKLCDKLLERARDAMERGNLDCGWGSLQAFDREMLVTLTDDELAARIVSVGSEAMEKLRGWRRVAAGELLGGDRQRDPGPGQQGGTAASGERERSPSSDPRAARLARLAEIMNHLHQESQNTYLKLGRLRTQLSIASLSVTIVVLGVLGINELGGFQLLDDRLQGELRLAVLSGLLGGVLSVAYTVARSNPRRKIPEVKASFSVTLTRPIIGAAMALPVLFLFHSGLINLGGEMGNGPRLWIILTFCFLGGFSERWFLGVVEKLEGEKG